MGEIKWDKAHFPHFSLILSSLVDFHVKNQDLKSNRHLHEFLWKIRQFVTFYNFFQLNWHTWLFIFNNTLEQITFDTLFATIRKKNKVTHFTPPGWGKVGHLPRLS